VLAQSCGIGEWMLDGVECLKAESLGRRVYGCFSATLTMAGSTWTNWGRGLPTWFGAISTSTPWRRALIVFCKKRRVNRVWELGKRTKPIALAILAERNGRRSRTGNLGGLSTDSLLELEDLRMSSQPLGKCLSQPDTCLTDRLLRPLRFVMAKLLRPMLGREEELFASLDIHLERIEQQQRQLAGIGPPGWSGRHQRATDQLRRKTSTTGVNVRPKLPLSLKYGALL